LEFLGDAVLDYLIASYLFSAYPKLKPGQLTDLRSLSVNNKAFACVAVDRSFDKYLLCDSNGLSEAIKKYVEYVRRPSTDSSIKEGPKCPKVDTMAFIQSCYTLVLLLLLLLYIYQFKMKLVKHYVCIHFEDWFGYFIWNNALLSLSLSHTHTHVTTHL